MKYIVFDLDDTLLDGQRQVTERTLKILRQVQDMGHRLVINTARSKGYSRELFRRIQPDYAILSGGALIIDRREKAIFHMEIPRQTTVALSRQLLTQARSFSVQTEDVLYTSDPRYTSQEAVYFDFAGEEFPWGSEKIMADMGDASRGEALARDFGLSYVSYLGGPWGRFTRPEATKAMGTRNLLAITGGTLSDVLAFGDDLGDMEMLREAGMGVLMCNARPEFLEMFPRHSQYANDHDGVARFLAEYFALEV